jgi:enterochelin esterase-like enzyme
MNLAPFATRGQQLLCRAVAAGVRVLAGKSRGGRTAFPEMMDMLRYFGLSTPVFS